MDKPTQQTPDVIQPDLVIKPNEVKNDWNDIQNKPKGKTLNQINEKGIVENIDANSIRSGLITGTTIQTAPSGARVVIGGKGDSLNDIVLVDNTTGGNSTVTGNTASIKFIREDDPTQVIRIQKRSGANDDNENVLEIFFEKDATGIGENYIFIGKKGADSNIYTDIIQAEFKDKFNVINKNSLSPNISVVSSEELQGPAGGTAVFIQASDDVNNSGYGQVCFKVYVNGSSTLNVTPLIIDKDGVNIISDDMTKQVNLTVNNATGRLEANGVPLAFDI